MSEYKDVLLNQDNILEVIEEFAEKNYENSEVAQESKGSRTRYNINSATKVFFLDVFFTKKGGTTIQVTNGKEQDEKIKLADYIIEHPLCQLNKGNNKNCSRTYKNISLLDFKSICNLIGESGNCASNEKVVDSSTEMRYNFIGKWKDKVVITYYKNTRKARIQGRPLLLFSEADSCFYQLIDEENIIDVLNDNYDQSLNKDTIDEDFKVYLPNSYDKHSPKLRKSLKKAVFNLRVPDNGYTCTELTFEVLRALEGHLRLNMMNDYNIKFNNNGKFTMFSFDYNTSICKLKESTCSIINDTNRKLIKLW